MEDRDRQRLAEALAFALDAHGDQQRKGPRPRSEPKASEDREDQGAEIPYASHLLQVAGLVLEHGGDTEQAIAGLLHDTIEDSDVTAELLRERFGPAVARMVQDCTDTLEGDTPERKSDWKLRKRRYLEHQRGVDARSALVAACDKRHNLGALVGDLRAEGSGYLERFSAGGEDQLWYFASFLEASGERLPARLRQEFEGLLAELRALLDDA